VAPKQDLRLEQVRGEHGGVRQEQLEVGAFRCLLQEPIPAAGNHHRVDDQVWQPARRG